MDAPDLDVWISAQTPPALEQTIELRPGDVDVVGRTPSDSLASGEMRLNAISEAAFTMGAQTALAWRYEHLLEFTKSQEGTLDRIASFAPFIVDAHMLLPSVTETRDRFDVTADQEEIRSVQIQYVIDEKPKAISQPPTWRDYLWREFPYPEPPHPALLPDTPEEVTVWEEGVRDGWSSGLEQAQLIWENNLNELVRDIRGRVTFRILENRGVVQRPQMVGSAPQVTEDASGNILNAGDTVYSITVPVEFEPQGQWEPLWREPDRGEPVLTPDAAEHDTALPLFTKP